MLRMDNLSTAIGASRIFSEEANGFHWVYPASIILSQGWRNGSQSGGDLHRNMQQNSKTYRPSFPASFGMGPLNVNLLFHTLDS